MRSPTRALIVGLFCAAAAAPVWVAWLVTRDPGRGGRRDAGGPAAGAAGPSDPGRGGRPAFRVELEGFEDGGVGTAARFQAPVLDPGSLAELREAILGRGPRGAAELRARYDALRGDDPPARDRALERLSVLESLGLLAMYEGKFDEAGAWVEKAIDACRAAGAPDAVRAKLTAVRGTVALRRGEVENCLGCVGPSSCIFPIAPEAVHKNQAGSREAVRWFDAYLKEWPGDLRVAWLLNIAHMTLGEYPDKVPPAALIPTGPFRSKADVGRFPNVATVVGLTSRGPNLAGGSVFDDLDGDHLPDLFTTSLDATKGASLFLNRGDGTFEDRSSKAGLDDQVYALNVTRTDFDNDGRLDLLLLRGAWEQPYRPSLLRNRGGGSFEDVTKAAGLGEPIQSEAAAWGDYDNDGWLDVYVCGEYVPPVPGGKRPPGFEPDPRNRGRLYHNNRDGTFTDVAAKAGVTNGGCGKGAAWGDYDGDGRPDLFVSNMGQPCRLYHNEGGGAFRDVAGGLGVTGPPLAFACWFWDYDNDGRLDLYVNDYRARPAQVVAAVLGVPAGETSRPALYRNLGPSGFRDVTREVGLDRPMAPMGANFGDVDNDGFPDLYLGTGDMSYSGLDLNLMFRNVDGRRFEDVTGSSGTGHLQKGHGVSFADYDGDGDLDLFVELGGAAPGDQGYNALFQNPGHGRHWLKVKLVGTRTNRAAIGARLQATFKGKGPGGATRSIYRTVGNNSSFGGNSLVELIGLGDADRVEELTVAWPSGGPPQTFHDLEADRSVVITEGAPAFEVVPRKPVTPPKP